MPEQGRRWRAWRQPGAWSLTGYPAPGPVATGPTGSVRVVVVDDSAEVRTLVRTKLRLSGGRGRRGRGRGRRRRRRPGPPAPARRHAARRLDAGHGRPGGAAAGARGVTAHAGGHVQRLRRGAARAAGARARRRVVPHQDVVAGRRGQRARGRRCGRRPSAGAARPRGAGRPAGRPGADQGRPARRPARRPAGRSRGRPRPGAARGPGRTVPERLRRRRDRHGHDDPAGPDRAGQRRAVADPADASGATCWAASYGAAVGDEPGTADAIATIVEKGADVLTLEHPRGRRRLPAHDAVGGPRPERPAALPAGPVPGRHPAARGRARAAGVGAPVPADRRGGPRLRHLHARPRGPGRQLERRCPARQGLDARRRSSASTSGSSTPRSSRPPAIPSTSSSWR